MVAEQLLLSPPLLTAPEEHLHCIAFPFGKARRRLRTLSPFLKSFGNFLLIALQFTSSQAAKRDTYATYIFVYVLLCFVFRRHRNVEGEGFVSLWIGRLLTLVKQWLCEENAT